MFFKSKKGVEVSASAAAALIAIIGALIVLYILFLPPEERAKILEETEEQGGVSGEEELTLLLTESPKRLLPVEKKEFEKLFPSVNIYVGEKGIKLKEVDSLYVSRSLFSSEKANITFEISDLENTKNSLLNFFVEKGAGRLAINLNGKEVFNREIEAGNINPINLKERLVQGINTLEFKVSSPGAVFWKTNEYSLSDILITADVISLETQKSTLTFVVGADEKDNLEDLKLRFLPECKVQEAGTLSISVNNYEIYSGIPDCGSPNRPLELTPERLVAGENELKFITNKGWYLIDQLKLTAGLKELIVPVYYFELDKDEFKRVDNKTANVTLYMKFVDDTSQKVADIFVNNHAMRLDQTEIEYNETINNYVEQGNNALKIEPEEVLDVVKLEVRFEK